MFKRSKAKTSKTQSFDLEQRMTQVENILNKLSENISAILNNNQDQTVYIDIDKLSIDKLDLEKLTFNIEGINVNELGESLSIGVNVDGGKMKVSPSREKENDKKQDFNLKKTTASSQNKAKQVNVNFTYK